MKSASTPSQTTALTHIRSDAAVALFLFLSGAVALVYEIVWQREFALVFGSAAPATAAVLAAYFAGLGTGALVIGRYARKWSRPLRVYAVLEVSVGIGALLVSPFLRSFESTYPWMFATFSNHPGGLMTVRTAAAFFALLVPTFCMGGTLPVLGEWVDRSRKQLGVTVGWLYVVNTVGAGLGALSVPFFFLPQLGLAHTVALCAGINAALALLAWLLDQRCAVSIEESRAVARGLATSHGGLEVRTGHRSVLLLAFISGLVTFAMQVLWNRAFAQVHENSMYSFAVIVAVVIFALAIGGQFARIGLRRGVGPNRLIGGAWFLAGLVVMTGPWLFFRLSHGLAYLPADEGWSAGAFHLVRLAILMLLLPVALLGIGLPAIMEQAGRSSHEATGRLLGRLLAVNVVGSVAGALIAGFVVPELLGLWRGLMGLGLLLFVAGLWEWTRPLAGDRPHRKFGFIVAAGAVAGAVAWISPELTRVRLAAGGTEKLLALMEGPHGITAVVERDGARRLKLNNFYGLGGTKATADERMQTHLPLLLHPAPRHVAFLGLGTGITAGAALFHPVEKVTVIELVPDVVRAARTYFREANLGVLDDPRTRVVEDDARHYLRGGGQSFDVIIGDLVVPWRQGEGSLFTLEQFQAAREALNPGGLFCQWLPLFQLSEGELKLLIRTFLTVFPRAEVWRGDFSPDEPAIALIGRAKDSTLEIESVKRRLAEMRPDSENPQLGVPSGFWMYYAGELATGDLSTDDLRINREDRPWIELLGPLSHAGGNKAELFIGRRLQAWLEELRRRSTERAGLMAAEEQTGMDAGATLAELVLCLSERNQAGADAAQQRLRRILPEASYRQIMQH